MKFNRRWLASGATAVALGAVVTGTALAQSNTPSERPPATAATDADDVSEDDAGEEGQQVTDDTARDRASAAALEAAGGKGTVTEVESADEGDSGYEVEVEKTDGSFVEVAVSDNFEVVSIEEDDD